MTRRLGVIGGGQLARMMIPPAIAMGIDIRVLAEGPGESAASAVVAHGSPSDLEAVLAFAAEVDVVTFDHEHVPQGVLRALVDSGVAVHPGPHALEFAQDKLRMRERLAELGVPIPSWGRVSAAAEVDAFVAAHGGRAVVKTARGGYDGKGVRVVSGSVEVEDWLARAHEDGGDGALLIEELVDFRRELSQLIARRPSGEARLWPVVESIQRGGVCAQVIAPAPGADARLRESAAGIASLLAERLDVTGVLAVEMFETVDGRLLVNELAMRPHNTGHWSIDGAATGQFEQHVRAVLDLPLGSTDPRQAWSVMVNVLGGPAAGGLDAPAVRALTEVPEVKLHLYGKAPRPGRKIGHVTRCGSELATVRADARRAAACFDA